MKKIISILCIMLLSTTTNAQKDVTTFLGIPVDGSKTSMIQKIKSKGFVYNQSKDCLTGEFNGNNVEIRIGTNNNKVYRIIVCDANTYNEADIKIRFNTLVKQFSKNKKYITANFEEADSYILSDEENIGYGITLYNKRYEAAFLQQPDMSKHDTLSIQNSIKEKIKSKYGEVDFQNPNETITKEMFLDGLQYYTEIVRKKIVWFMIDEKRYGKYSIIMYYDNEYNHSDGEDL